MSEALVERPVNIIRIGRIIRARWKTVIFVTSFVTLLTIILTLFVLQPVYQCNVKMFIGKSIDEDGNYSNNDIVMYQSLMKTYVEIINTEDLIERSLSKIDSKVEPAEVLSNLSVEAINDTQILQVTLEGKDKKEIYKILASITEEFVATAKTVLPNGNVQVIRNAKEPQKQISPNIKINIVIGILSGVLLGGIIVFIKEFKGSCIETKEEVEEKIGIPVLGTIPKNYKDTDVFEVDKNPKSVISEEYRILRTNLKYTSFEKYHRVFQVTSAVPGEGKSTVSINLALALAEEAKVVLIDCDMRKPSIHKKLNISRKGGLSDILIGKSDIMDVAYRYNKNLLIITAGNSIENPSEMLGSRAMERMIRRLKDVVDYVIIDAPPVQAVTDPQILSTIADGTIIVVKSGERKSKEVLNTIDLLNKVKGNILGIVLKYVEVNNKKYV